MFTINLEEELQKQPKDTRLYTEEWLQVREYEKLGDNFSEDTILGRLGLNENAKAGKEIKKELSKTERRLKRYNPEKLYHISQIEKLCKKYRLRFLPVKMYSGTVDAELAKKVSNFEIAYGTECNQGNCMIVAPAKSFRLEAQPEDPLFFKKVAKDWYYLIHKWGNDLSLFRRIKPERAVAYLLWIAITVTIYYLAFIYKTVDRWLYHPKVTHFFTDLADYTIVGVLTVVATVGGLLIYHIKDEEDWDKNFA